MPTERPTIRTVAERAGVSKSLVSLVLQNSDKVSPQRRAAVERAIAELGYRPSMVARSLSVRRTGAIGVVIDDLRNPWFVECYEGLAGALGSGGYRTLLADERVDRATGGSLVQTLVDMGVDGLVLLGTMTPSDDVRRAVVRLPAVVAASRDFDDDDLDVVAGDDRAGIALAVEHLLSLRHRSIAHVAGSTGAVPRLRRAAFVDAMAAAGTVDPVVIDGDMSDVGGYRAGLELLGRPERPTAVVAVNDVTALGVLSAARELGLAVPGEVSIVGYDDTAIAGLGLVDLTTIDVRNREVGDRAGRTLLRRLNGDDGDRQETLVEPRLVVRGSTGPAV